MEMFCMFTIHLSRYKPQTTSEKCGWNCGIQITSAEFIYTAGIISMVTM